MPAWSCMCAASLSHAWLAGAGAASQLAAEKTATTSGGVNELTGANITEIPSQWNLSNPDPGSGPLAPLNATVSSESRLCLTHQLWSYEMSAHGAFLQHAPLVLHQGFGHGSDGSVYWHEPQAHALHASRQVHL